MLKSCRSDISIFFHFIPFLLPFFPIFRFFGQRSAQKVGFFFGFCYKVGMCGFETVASFGGMCGVRTVANVQKRGVCHIQSVVAIGSMSAL